MSNLEFLRDRFLEKVYCDPNTGCFLWYGYTTPTGYGQLSWRKDGQYRCMYAHRLSFEIFKGPIPEGLSVCHSCDTPACVNPDHLWVGTASENRRDAFRKGRVVIKGTPARLRVWGEIGALASHPGSLNGRAKLTREIVSEIRSRPRESAKSLGAEFGVSGALIWQIRHEKIWRELV